MSRSIFYIVLLQGNLHWFYGFVIDNRDMRVIARKQAGCEYTLH